MDGQALLHIKRLIKRIFRQIGLDIKKSPSNLTHEVDYFYKILQASDVDCVLYVGANRGQYVDQIRRQLPNSKIFLYEPDPDLFQILEKEFGSDKRITLNQVAVTNKPGMSILKRTSMLSNKRLSSSLLEMTKLHEEWSLGSKQIDSIEVKTIALDNENLDSFNKILLKIDIQGMELPALEGAIKLLSNKIIAIDTEVSFQELYKNETRYFDLFAFLDKYEFKVFSINPWGIYYANKNELLQADFQFIKNKILKN